jgi:hypothetical protein
MRPLNFAWALGALALFGCGGPVPDGVFLTMTASGEGVKVEGSINGKPNEFLSGGEGGSLVTSMPLNRFVHEGENEVSFVLSRATDDEEFTPSFRAVLEVSIKGEIVDSQAPGERVIIDRQMTDEEAANVAAGETVTITEGFTVDKAKLSELAGK